MIKSHGYEDNEWMVGGGSSDIHGAGGGIDEGGNVA